MTDTQQLVFTGIQLFIVFASVWTFLAVAALISLFRKESR